MTGVFAAVLAVLSQISIPMPSGVPITLQTFAVALCGYALGPVSGVLAVTVYLALGALGVPVFAGFSGGFGIFLGMTGGFLWGFLPLAFLCGLGARSANKPLSAAFGLAGLLLCHVCGAAQYAFVASVPFPSAFVLVSVPYLVKDIVSTVLACLGSLALVAALKKSGLAGGGQI